MQVGKCLRLRGLEDHSNTQGKERSLFPDSLVTDLLSHTGHGRQLGVHLIAQLTVSPHSNRLSSTPLV